MDAQDARMANRINFLSLGFYSSEMEVDYRRWSYEKSLRLVKVFLIIAVLVHLTILPLEKTILGPGYERFWTIRIFILIPSCLLTLLITYQKWFYKWNQSIYMVLTLLNGLAMALGLWMYPYVEIIHFVRAAITVIMFSVALLGMRFVNAAMSTWVIIISCLITLFAVRTNQQLLLSEVSMLVVFGLTLTFIAYKQELTERNSYISMLTVQDSERRNQERESARRVWLENLAGFLKHEIKNSISGVLTSHRLLQRHIDDDEAKKYLLRAEKSVAMIDNLLETVTQATSMEMALYAETRNIINLDELILNQTESYKMIYPDVIFDCDLDGHNVQIEGMEERVLQILDNLIINAIEHNVDNRPIQIRLKTNKDTCQLSVINEGESLPDENEKMYALFYTSKSGDEKAPRRGLGLYVAKMIAEGYGGSIMARKPEDMEGAEFVVSFPMLGMAASS